MLQFNIDLEKLNVDSKGGSAEMNFLLRATRSTNHIRSAVLPIALFIRRFMWLV